MLAGAAFGLSLIVVIGSQNAYVLRQGLRREHVALVVTICAVPDVVLILAGVAGFGALVDAAPRALDVLSVIGAVFLLTYAAIAARRAIRPDALTADTGGASITARRAAATAVALTWLNPHVYLDTVVLLGSVARSHGDDRWWFAIGAAAGSIAWFTTLGLGARALRPVFAKPVAWRILDTLIAVLMVVIAVHLLRGLQ